MVATGSSLWDTGRNPVAMLYSYPSLLTVLRLSTRWSGCCCHEASLNQVKGTASGERIEPSLNVAGRFVPTVGHTLSRTTNCMKSFLGSVDCSLASVGSSLQSRRLDHRLFRRGKMVVHMIF